ncbi:hypothetical protein [Pararhodobacter sp. CCB-MM2]|nr:hypothetical protein [Pararhodobacter sp. CCB-MM2]MCA2012655.1 hypothetical protein [Cereibacter sphaeroides]
MAKSSRWMQWVIAESASARVPLPWVLRRRLRLRRAAMEARKSASA